MAYKFFVLAISLMLLSISELMLFGNVFAKTTEISTAEINTVSTLDSLDTENLDVVNRGSIERPQLPFSERSTPVANNLQPTATDLD